MSIRRGRLIERAVIGTAPRDLKGDIRMKTMTCTAIAAALVLALPGCNQQEPADANEGAATEVAAADLSALNGVWKTDLASAKWEGKPDEFALKDGSYTCSTCIPPLTAVADGEFHPVADRPYYDSLSVKAVDNRTVEFRRKKGDKDVGSSTMNVSEDGNTLTNKWQDRTTTPATDGTVSLKRAGPAPAGAHAISGQWSPERVQDMTEEALNVSYEIAGNKVKSTVQGQTYEAELDGPAVPVQNDPGGTTVAVTREGANGLRETYSRDGKVVAVYTIVPNADGKSVSIVNTDPRDGSKTSWTSNKAN